MNVGRFLKFKELLKDEFTASKYKSRMDRKETSIADINRRCRIGFHYLLLDIVCCEWDQSLSIKSIVAIKLKDIEDSLIYQYAIFNRIDMLCS